VKRGIVVDRVDLEFKRVSSDWCCGQLFMGKNNFGAVNVTLHIHNAGDVAETVTVKANLGVGLGSRFTLFDIVLPEVKLINLALGGKLEGYGEEQTRTVTIGAHNDGEVSFIWKCVVTDKGDFYISVYSSFDTQSDYLDDRTYKVYVNLTCLCDKDSTGWKCDNSVGRTCGSSVTTANKPYCCSNTLSSIPKYDVELYLVKENE